MIDQTGHKRNLVVLAVILNDKEQVLLAKRNQPLSKHSHGKWHFPGGGIEHGEHPVDAVLREIREEIGPITVQLMSESPMLYSNIFEEGKIHAILLGFPVKYISGDIDVSQDEETEEAKWFDIKDLDTLDSLPGTKELAAKAQKLVTSC